ncbi:glycosyltransferase [Acrocarpospora catenulata]|uniref:glycosyltransferase n=1 Tax=Acrocarpospora catenulata TaxID=2836182 RepID=UPI001BDA77D5|nr:glycosyltransferase [Acrocarpospora catenulata]
MSSAPLRVISLTVFALLAIAAWRWGTPEEFGPLGVLLLTLLSLKLLLSLCYRPNRRTSWHGDFAVIVPIFNEDPEILRRCLTTLRTQSRTPRWVVVIDDGSTEDAAVPVAESMIGDFQEQKIELIVLRQPENTGKREALARGFEQCPDAEVYVCVDSDTLLHPGALDRLLAPLGDEQVTAVTGLVLAANFRVNVLTRLIDLRYANAFLYERAAYSLLRSVLCCCGSLAAYRGRVVHKHLTDFRTQRFLGRRAVVGDDRRLTNYCLLEGQVLFQSSALAETAVPERLGHYLRQQSRWNRSFFRETLWCLRTFPRVRPTAWLLSFIEIATWLTFTATLIYSLLIFPLLYGRLLLPQYSAMIVIFGYLRSVRYLDLQRPGISWPQQFAIFAIAPLYGVMHVALLLPVRVFSLLTLRRTAWGTRKTVEVSLAEGHELVGAATTSPPRRADDPGVV